MNQPSGSKGSLQLPADCSIGAIRGIYDTIREAFSRQQQIEIDCSGVDKADVTSIQLLLSTTKTGKAEGRKIVLTAFSQAFRNVLRRAGFASDESINRHFHQQG